jgi:hypothetical protein
MPKLKSNDATGSESDAPAQGGVTKFEAWTPRQISREQITNAPYNPRQITDEAKGKLREAIRRVGLVQPIVWNSRTGNIVGGHQRISQIDALEGNRKYVLTVAAIDVDDVREKELNILLNNPETQGDWELDKLKQLLDTEGLDLGNAGFNLSDVMQMFGEAPHQDTTVQKELADQLKGVRESFEKLNEMTALKDDDNFYAVVVFKSHAERRAFTDRLGFADNRYVSGRSLMERIPEAKQPEPAL